MGRNLFTEYEYHESTRSRGITDARKAERVTAKAEQRVRETGKLDPAVDPAVDPIRRSLMRFDPTADKRWQVTVGCPMNIEVSLDSTGSMGDNVDRALRVLPDTYRLAADMLKGYDPQLAVGIFGDICDRFALCRPQFEMTAEKIVDYLTKMHPEGSGGDSSEDQQYAAFAAAYLTDAYTHRLGLKGYHFTVTDASCHEHIHVSDLERIFGKEVWQLVADNNHPEISRTQVPDIQDVYLALAEYCHAFMILLDASEWEEDFWRGYYRERVVTIYAAEDLPAVQAALIGYTEGVLQPLDVEDYLKQHKVRRPSTVAKQIGQQVFAAQRKLEQASGLRIPQAGEIFAKKTDLQADEAPATPANTTTSPEWL